MCTQRGRVARANSIAARSQRPGACSSKRATSASPPTPPLTRSAARAAPRTASVSMLIYLRPCRNSPDSCGRRSTPCRRLRRPTTPARTRWWRFAGPGRGHHTRADRKSPLRAPRRRSGSGTCCGTPRPSCGGRKARFLEAGRRTNYSTGPSAHAAFAPPPRRRRDWPTVLRPAWRRSRHPDSATGALLRERSVLEATHRETDGILGYAPARRLPAGGVRRGPEADACSLPARVDHTHPSAARRWPRGARCASRRACYRRRPAAWAARRSAFHWLAPSSEPWARGGSGRTSLSPPPSQPVYVFSSGTRLAEAAGPAATGGCVCDGVPQVVLAARL